MLHKHELLILISVILLVPILLGMTPLNMAHRLASGGTFAQGKEHKLNNHCLFNSLVSHDDLTVGILNSTLLDKESLSSQELRTPVLDSVRSNIFFSPGPLRC
jgi:hypothetical protein